MCNKLLHISVNWFWIQLLNSKEEELWIPKEWINLQRLIIIEIGADQGHCPFTKNFQKLPWKGPSSEERVPFHSSCSRLRSRHQIQDGGTVITVNSLEQVITCQKTRKLHMHFHPKVPAGKQDYHFKVPLISGNFPVERPENVCSINIPNEISRISW